MVNAFANRAIARRVRPTHHLEGSAEQRLLAFSLDRKFYGVGPYRALQQDPNRKLGNPLTLTLELARVIRRLGGSVPVGFLLISTKGVPLAATVEVDDRQAPN